MILNLHAC